MCGVPVERTMPLQPELIPQAEPAIYALTA
jgi:hypothetical protein